MNTYTKNFTVLVPDGNWDKEIEAWLLESSDSETVNKYLKIHRHHEELVKQADRCGDRQVNIYKNGIGTQVEIRWISDEVHMKYMHQIPLSDRQFYEKVWNDFYNSKK